jgi:hypothetical protein
MAFLTRKQIIVSIRASGDWIALGFKTLGRSPAFAVNFSICVDLCLIRIIMGTLNTQAKNRWNLKVKHAAEYENGFETPISP